MHYDEEWHEEFTHEELSKSVDQWWESLGEDGQSRWYLDPIPTLEMYVLGQIKEGDKVCINFYAHIFAKI